MVVNDRYGRPRYICDREIGSPRTGWRICRRRAVVVLLSRHGIFLHACARHEAAMVADGCKVWRRVDRPPDRRGEAHV